MSSHATLTLRVHILYTWSKILSVHGVVHGYSVLEKPHEYVAGLPSASNCSGGAVCDIELSTLISRDVPLYVVGVLCNVWYRLSPFFDDDDSLDAVLFFPVSCMDTPAIQAQSE